MQRELEQPGVWNEPDRAKALGQDQDRVHTDQVTKSVSSENTFSTDLINPDRLHEELGKLGEGGMGVVYLAEHKVMKKKAAVKVLRAELSNNEEIAKRFINEATAAASIPHPGIVDVMDVGTHSTGCLFILMEFLEGESLADRIRRASPLAPDDAATIIRQTAGALRAAHRANIIHRDLKPSEYRSVR